MGFIIGTGMLILGIVGIISLVILIFVLFAFGRIIKHQFKIWTLAKKGYTQIRHVKEDMTEKYYFLRIKNEHFDFDKGIYMEQKDIKTKTATILAPLDYKLLSSKPDESLSAEEVQIKKFLRGIEDSKVMDITTLSWGIPTLTYFGNNPNPVNIKDVKKVYDAKNIAALIKRILMTKEWKLVRIALIVAMISLGLWVVLGFLDYGLATKNANNLNLCINQLNATSIKYQELLNSSRIYNVVANSTITI
jgi:hypothetical protein